MSDLSKDALEIIVKHLSDRIALAILFASVIAFILMWTPTPLGRELKVHLFLITACLLLSACYVPTRYVLEYISDYFASRKMHSRLDNLVPEEKRMLAIYIRNGIRTYSFSVGDAVARGLADDGIFYAPEVAYGHNGRAAYNILDKARIYLEKNPKTLQIGAAR